MTLLIVAAGSIMVLYGYHSEFDQMQHLGWLNVIMGLCGWAIDKRRNQ